ncbi:MAG: aspartate aminotransferase family protein [Balneolaceae bacterium]
MSKTKGMFQKMENDHHFDIYKRYSLTLVKGSGSLVWDEQGNEYLDALAGIAVNNVGHCHPKVTEAIREQAGKLIHISNLYYSEPQSRLAELLTGMSGMDRAFFCNSGAEANEAALKIARKHGNLKGKKGPILSMDNCFHGRTFGTIAMGKAKYSKSFEPMPSGFDRVPVNDLNALESAMNEDTIALFLEPILGEGGVVPVDTAYLKKARELCDKYEALLIFDEIQCGLGRTGAVYAWMHSGVKPDILTTAKALGGGFPIGATLATEAAASILSHGEHGTTYGGNPLACAAAVAALNVIRDEDLAGQARIKGEYMVKELRERTEGWDTVKEVRGTGLMIGVELTFKGAPVVEKMLEKGVLSNCASDTVMRLLPPLVIRQEEMDRLLDVLLDSIRECGSLVGETPQAEQ